MASKTAPLSLRYHPLEKISLPHPVDRIEYIKRQCAGKRVLDLGAYDETVIGQPQHPSWRWLHSEIAKVSKEVLGVDSCSEVQAKGSVQTAFGTRILYGTVDDLTEVISGFKPDIIVAGELIEHTPNTLGWISSLSRLATGTRFIATTPNATSIINLVLSFIRRENCHRDHLHLYSYKTLTTMARHLNMKDLQIVPYYYDPHLFVGRGPGWVIPFIYTINLLVMTPLQYLFPLTAFGLIIDGLLGQPSSGDGEN